MLTVLSPIKRENPPVCVILQIVTCGFYYFIMLYRWLKAINNSGDRPICDPALAIMLSVVTCGLAAIYFDYQVVAYAEKIASRSGVKNSGSPPMRSLKDIVLYGSIVGFIVSLASGGILSWLPLVFFLWVNCAIQYSVEYAFGVAE